ncbi:MAG: copper homeostasis protein CutC [Bacteroidota bacterium]
MTLEICIDSVASALAAEAGGADRVELCDNLVEGGTTPSHGMVDLVKERCSLPIMMMIRPRGGDFFYTEEEYAVMKQNIRWAKSMGVQGVVFGILKQDGSIDLERNKELIELARPLEVTFHRAFDVCNDPLRALDELIVMGVDRLLTSGLQATAEQGIPLIRDLVQRQQNEINIMAGGGVRPHNVKKIIQETGIHEVHATGRMTFPSPMEYTNPVVFMGAPGQSEYTRTQTDVGLVREMVREIPTNLL